ncbi:MAG TPA: hypothetical protein VGZ73_25510 [Bryobacteraceae bacterium]|nr:hypothetical protein [Bryobacteraceae bacterium]
MVTLVRRARRRLFGNELLAQGANAGSAALGAVILLLLAGTQILNWQWALPIPLIAAVAGFYRARRRVPSAYAVAQIVDHRMSLQDSLSTAFFFSQNEAAARVSAEVRKLQFDRADRLAESVDVRRAIPYTVPRTVYVMAALTLVASSLFALRYGLTRSLDLKPPLASILQQSFGSEPKTEQARNKRPLPQPEPQMEPDDSGANIQDPDQKAGDQPDSDAANASEESGDSKVPGDSKAANNDAKKQADEGEKSDGDQKDERSGEGESPNGQQGDSKSDPKENASAKQDSSNSGDSSSLMSKVKDAVQNLLSRMKPQQGQSGSQQQQQSMDQKSSQGKQQQGSKQQGGKDGQQQQGGQQGDAQEGQSGEEAQNAQDPQGKGTGKSENQQPSKQPGSGIGSQDGDKSIKQAEQLAAMGKISEIFGKRSANITGEATVEVQNTSQQLRTQYTQRGVQHTQSGAQINRDEIPVVLQTYVEQYFDQVRKQKK